MDGSDAQINDAFFPSDDESSAAVALADGSPNNDTATDSSKNGKLLSDLVCYLFEIIVYTFLCGVMSMFGICTNVINLLVFHRQSTMRDSVTMSLAGLAVADLCCLITMLWLSINYAIIMVKPKHLPWDPLSVLYITAGWPHVMFTRVTCWITAFVAFERCLCVIRPFKVREIFTPLRALCIFIGIFIFIISCYFPIFYTHRLQWNFNPATNTTILSLSFTEGKDTIEHICHLINDVIFPTASLAIVMVCMKLTVSQLHSSSKWRSNVTCAARFPAKSESSISTIQTDVDIYDGPSSMKPDHCGPANTLQEVNDGTKETVPPKEKKVIRMITLICTIFLICNTPCILIIYLRFAVPEIANLGKYHNLFHVLYSLDFLFESVSSSINIFVYYRLSSKYKTEFRALFCLQE